MLRGPSVSMYGNLICSSRLQKVACFQGQPQTPDAGRLAASVKAKPGAYTTNSFIVADGGPLEKVCQAQISEQMWTLWPQLIQCFHEWAIDYFENILVPLDNFISRGTDTFLSGQNPNYLRQARPRTPCPALSLPQHACLNATCDAVTRFTVVAWQDTLGVRASRTPSAK